MSAELDARLRAHLSRHLHPGMSDQNNATEGELVVHLTKAGRYTFFCPIPGHKQAGMVGTLVVLTALAAVTVDEPLARWVATFQPSRLWDHVVGVLEYASGIEPWRWTMHVVLCAGRALVGVTEDPVELHPGDYITYPGDVAHVFEALDPGTVAVMVSEHG